MAATKVAKSSMRLHGRARGRGSPRVTAGRSAAPRPRQRRPAREGDDQRVALALELQVLRRAVEESVEHLLDRLRGRLASLVDGLGKGAMDDRRTVRLREERIAAALVRMRTLKLKPHKGRVKDLARVGDLLDKLDVLLRGDS